MPSNIFISYTQPDRETASRAHDLFQANGLHSWIARSPSIGIPVGADYEGEIVRAIRASHSCVLIYSNQCNQSENILQELRQHKKVKGQQFILFRLDNAPFGDNVSLYLEGSQYIDARRNLPQALTQLLTAVRRGPNAVSGDDIPTDQLLLNAGLRLLEQKNYAQAATRLQQYLDIEPDDPVAAFYLTLALIGGRPAKKLDGLVVRRLEAILMQADGAARVLLAILKEGYYSGNGFNVPPPSPEELLENATIDPEAAAALLFHIDEPPDNRAWKYIHKQLQ
jgi:tetratricopeptide (TPR) repeat protein